MQCVGTLWGGPHGENLKTQTNSKKTKKENVFWDSWLDPLPYVFSMCFLGFLKVVFFTLGFSPKSLKILLFLFFRCFLFFFWFLLCSICFKLIHLWDASSFPLCKMLSSCLHISLQWLETIFQHVYLYLVLCCSTSAWLPALVGFPGASLVG